VLSYGKLWREWIWLVLIMVVVWFLEDVVPRLWGKLRRRLWKVAQPQEPSNGSKADTPESTVVQPGPTSSQSIWNRGKVIFTTISVLIIILFTPYIAGMATAKQKEDYVVVRIPNEYVALRMYDDRIIAAPLIRERHEFEPVFVILKPGDNPTTEMELQQVGPLKPSKSQ
jgi:hypothetical protein